MTYKVEIPTKVVKEMRSIPSEDLRRIERAIDGLAEEPRPAGVTKMVDGSGWRLRVGDWRIVYVIDDTIRVVSITRIRRRGDVYR